MRIKSIVFVLALVSLTAHAGGIYRCKTNGKTVYAASCPDGAPAKTVNVWSVPTGDDVSQAKAQSDAAREKLNMLEKEQALQVVQEERVHSKRSKKKKVANNTPEKSKRKVTRVRVRKSWVTKSKAKLASDK